MVCSKSGAERRHLSQLPETDFGPVIRALRRAGDEAELTRVIHAFAETDQRFASGFASLVVAEASRAKSSGAHARALPDLSGETMCERERTTGRLTSESGRCDLWFSSAGPPPVTLAVELKLRSGYTVRQREKYVAELRRRVKGASWLVVVTARAHVPPSRTLARNPRWLGEVKWAELHEHGLAELDFEPGHEGLRLAWRAFVTTLLEDGDLGLLANIDPERFDRWASGDPHVSRGHATNLLEGIAAPARELLDEMLKAHGLRSRPMPATDSGHLVYVRGKGYVELTWTLTPRGGEQLQFLLKPSDGKGGDDRAQLEVWYIPRRTQTHLVRRTDGRRAGFRYDGHWHGWWRTYRLDPAVSGAELGRAVLAHWRRSLRALEKLGAQEGLLRTPGSRTS
jgi:hypothetical protein